MRFLSEDHISYKSPDCPKSNANNRKVVVCELCSISIKTTGFDGEDEELMLQKHEKSSDCDLKKKKKPTYPVRRWLVLKSEAFGGLFYFFTNINGQISASRFSLPAEASSFSSLLSTLFQATTAVAGLL